MKIALKLFSIKAMICVLIVLGINIVSAEEEWYSRYGLYDLNFYAVDNYIMLRFWDTEAYKVFTNIKICKNQHVQKVYSDLVEQLAGNEKEAEVFVLFEKLVYREALNSVNSGKGSVEELIKSAPNTLTLLGLDYESYNKIEKFEDYLLSLNGNTFNSIEALVDTVNNIIGGTRIERKSKITDISDPAVKKAVEYLVEAGIVSGKTDSEFFPNDKVTREEFVKMLVLALNLYEEGFISEFTDVTEKDWYYNYVLSGVNAGLIKGYGNIFGVGDYITREDASVILYRAIDKNKLNTVNNINYTDEKDISDYAVEAVKMLTAADFMSGINGIFAPKEYMTRATSANLIYSLVKDYVKGE
jgi:hypothetical protein